jgi:hypothetical protein
VSQLGPTFDTEVRRDARRAEQYRGITRNNQFSRREKSKSIFESILEDAKGSPIAGVVSGIGSGLASVGQFLAPSVGSQIQREEELGETQRGQALSMIPGGAWAGKPITSAIGAAEVAGEAWSRFVTRPGTAVALTVDPTSPLYKGEVFAETEDGRRVPIQPENIFDAFRISYNRSADVSFGDAVMANPLLTLTNVPAHLTQANTYNPWSDVSVNEASENPVHYFMASAINLAPELLFAPPARAGRIKAQGAVGLRTTVETGEQLSSYRALWREHQARKQIGDVPLVKATPEEQASAATQTLDEFGLPTSALDNAPEVPGLGGALRLRQSAGYARGARILEEGELTPESAAARLRVLSEEARESGKEKLANDIENSLSSIDPQTLVDDPNFWPRIIGEYEFDLNKFGVDEVELPDYLASQWDTSKRILQEQEEATASYLARLRQEAPAVSGDMVPAQGSLAAQDPYSMLIEDIASETRWAKILENPLVANSLGVQRTKLARILAKTDDPDTINEIILASRGDYEALYNLQQAAPEHVWSLGDMNDVIRNIWVEKGLDFYPRGEQLALVNQIFDSPINRDEYFREIKDFFLQGGQETGLLSFRGGATWMPTSVMQVERVRMAGRKAKYMVTQADYEDAPQWIIKVVNAGNGTPVSTFVQWSSSRQPLGTVSLSGTRPDDWFVELNSQFNSIPIFRGNKMVTVGHEKGLVDGELVPIQMPASKYRQQLLQQLIDEEQQVGILQAWRNMEDRIITVMADEANVRPDQALAFARGGRQNLAERFGYLAESGGFLFDAEYGRMVVSPKTLGQLIDSFPTLPLDEIYRAMRSEQALLYLYGTTTQELITSAFDAGMKFFRANVLFKPSYFFKFGALEPMIVSQLAHGTVFADEGFMATMRNMGKNWARRSKRVAYVMELDTLAKKVFSREPAKTRGQTERYIKTLLSERALTERQVDIALMDLDRIQTGKVSPAQARNDEILIRNQLVEAQLRLDAIEDALDGNMPQWRQVVEPASYRDVAQKMSDYRAIINGDTAYVQAVRDQIEEINRIARERAGGKEPVYTPNENAMLSRLEASLKRLESKPKDMTAFAAQVDELQRQMDSIPDLVQEFTDPARRIEELNQSLELIDQKLGAARVQMGEARRKIDATGMSGYAGSGNGYITIMVGGRSVKVPGAFSTRQFDFGEALRAETSAALANRLLFDPSYAVARSASRWERTSEPVRIGPDDPLYWPELAWIVNSKFREDPLVGGKILAGATRAQAAEWLATPAGRKYQKTMGVDYLVKRETYSDPVSRTPQLDVGLSERPSKVGRQPRMLLQSTTELDEMFRLVEQYLPDRRVRDAAAAAPVTPGQLQAALGNNPNLKPIAGDDFIYSPGSIGTRIADFIRKAADIIWENIATKPEDRIARWPFYNREFKKQLQIRVNIAESQGARLDPEGEAMDALRQSAKRAALDELEKVFYNIRRYNSPVYMSRFLAMFPGAFVNSIYRYSRLAVKEPERTFQALVVADTILSEGAVDDDGNPVSLDEATYIIVPGTKKGPGDTGLRVPVASLETLSVAMPSVSYLVNMSIAAIVSQKPDVEESIRKALGDTLFNEMFPYGLPRDPVRALFSSYQRSFGKAATALLRKAVGLEVSDKEFLQTSVQFYANAMAEWEKSGAPIEEAPQFDDAVSDATGYYAQRAFFAWAPPFNVRTDVPGQLWRDNWYRLREQYGDDIQGARDAYIKQNGEWARWFTYSSSDYSSYIPSTQEAYRRVWVDHPDLARKLVALAGDDLSMVSLLALGTSGEFSQPVSDFLRNNPLPGDDVPVVSRMTPEQFQNMVFVEDGWNQYSRNRAKFDAEQKRLRALRDTPDISPQQKQLYRDMIAENDNRWSNVFVKNLEEENKPWAVARSQGGKDRAKNAAIFLETMLEDKKFATTTGRTELFSDIGFFLKQREKALTAIENSKTDEGRKANKDKFLAYVNEQFLEESPEFASFWDRYFSSEWMVD